MVVVAQLVRAPGCGPGGRRFETDLPPQFKKGLFISKQPFFNAFFEFCMLIISIHKYNLMKIHQ